MTNLPRKIAELLVSLVSMGLQFVASHLYLAAYEFRTFVIHVLNFHLRASRYMGKSGFKLNLGCGPNYKSNWLNIDLSSSSDLRLDLRKPLPLPDGSCSTIYSEHFFEHLAHPSESILHLRECWRMLEDGGILHIGVPNAGEALLRYARLHMNGKLDEQFERHPAHPGWVKTRMDAINFLFRQNYTQWNHEHKWAYDFVSLKGMLEVCGFVKVAQRDYDTSLDSEKRRTSLYVQAMKA